MLPDGATLKNNQICQKVGKKWRKKAFFYFPLKPIFGLIPGTQKYPISGTSSVTNKHMEANEIFSLEQIQNASFIYAVPLTKVTNNVEFWKKSF